MNQQELLELIAAGERHGVEFKNPRRRSDRPRFREIARAILAMANRRDGGLVVVGVEDNGTITGLTPEQVTSWENRDHVRQSLRGYAVPFVSVNSAIHKVDVGGSERTLAVLQVDEFETLPVLCTRSGHDANGDPVIREGACYIRSRAVTASVEVSTEAEMRELLDLAVEKGVRQFLAREKAVGFMLQQELIETVTQAVRVALTGHAAPAATTTAQVDAAEQFRKQRERS